jgi:hypothetical protein
MESGSDIRVTPALWAASEQERYERFLLGVCLALTDTSGSSEPHRYTGTLRVRRYTSLAARCRRCTTG